jgi:hypothetical protein
MPAAAVALERVSAFVLEALHAIQVCLGRGTMPVLPLAQIVAGKKATGRPKGAAILPALEHALRTLTTPRQSGGGHA